MFQLILLTHLRCVHILPAPALPLPPPAPRAGYSPLVPEVPAAEVRAQPEPALFDLSWIVPPSPALPHVEAPSPPCITSP